MTVCEHVLAQSSNNKGLLVILGYYHSINYISTTTCLLTLKHKFIFTHYHSLWLAFAVLVKLLLEQPLLKTFHNKSTPGKGRDYVSSTTGMVLMWNRWKKCWILLTASHKNNHVNRANGRCNTKIWKTWDLQKYTKKNCLWYFSTLYSTTKG